MSYPSFLRSAGTSFYLGQSQTSELWKIAGQSYKIFMLKMRSIYNVHDNLL